MSILKILLITLSAGANPSSVHELPVVSDFLCGTNMPTRWANVQQVNSAYGRQSVEIVEAGLQGNVSKLSAIVSPDAEFVVFEGDFGQGPRVKGSQAAIEFVKKIAPIGYRFNSGSFAGLSMSPCGQQEAKVTLLGPQEDLVTEATFTFREGVLMGISANRVRLVSGRFRNRR